MNTLIQLLSSIVIFIGAFIGIYNIQNKKYNKGIKKFLKIGIIPLALISTYRHIMFNNSNFKNQRLFEFEAGGANLAIAIASIIILSYNMDNKSMGIIFLIYMIYLFMSLLAWIIYSPKISTTKVISFIFIISILTYFSYISFTKNDEIDRKI